VPQSISTASDPSVTAGKAGGPEAQGPGGLQNGEPVPPTTDGLFSNRSPLAPDHPLGFSAAIARQRKEAAADLFLHSQARRAMTGEGLIRWRLDTQA